MRPLPDDVRLALKRTPNSVIIICATVVVCTIVACLTALAYGNKSADDLTRFINTVLNIGGFVFGGGAFLASGYAASRSNEAAENTNGKLKQTVHEAVATAVKESQNGE